MNKVIYKNTFYIAITFLVITLLFFKNFARLMMSGDLLAAFVLTIQAIVLYQIKIKHKYVVLGIRTWAIYPIIKEGLMVGIALLFLAEGGIEFIDDPQKTILSVLQFVAGLLIFYYADRAIEVTNDE